MLDEKDLQAIAQLLAPINERLGKLEQQETRMDTKLAAMEQRLDAKLTAAEQRIAKSTVVLMDAEFQGKFNLLAEGQEEILRRMPNEDDMDIIDERLHDLEADVAALKKAN